MGSSQKTSSHSKPSSSRGSKSDGKVKKRASQDRTKRGRHDKDKPSPLLKRSSGDAAAAAIADEKRRLRTLRVDLEKERLEQSTKKKIDALQNIRAMIKEGTMAAGELDAQYERACRQIDREAKNERDPQDVRQEDEPAIVIGEQAKRGQLSTTIDPYDQEPIKQVGTLPEEKRWTAVKIRFDYNYLICAEQVTIPASNNMNEVQYWAWSIKKVKTGHSDEEERDVKGKKMKAFNFSGRLTSLPELHLALREQYALSGEMHVPTVEDIYNNEDQLLSDEHGIINIHSRATKSYPTQIVAFGEFRCYIEETSYKTYGGSINHHKVLTITKRKSDLAIKNGKPNAPGFFMLQIPVRNLDLLIRACHAIMLYNGMQVLAHQDKDETFASIHPDDVKKLTMGNPSAIEGPANTDDEDDADDISDTSSVVSGDGYSSAHSSVGSVSDKDSDGEDVLSVSGGEAEMLSEDELSDAEEEVSKKAKSDDEEQRAARKRKRRGGATSSSSSSARRSDSRKERERRESRKSPEVKRSKRSVSIRKTRGQAKIRG